MAIKPYHVDPVMVIKPYHVDERPPKPIQQTEYTAESVLPSVLQLRPVDGMDRPIGPKEKRV